MKIPYKFVTGEVTMVEVSDELGAVIIASRREEHNRCRKERYHCRSLDDLDYENERFGNKYTPETDFLQKLDNERMNASLKRLTPVQRRRLMMYADGLSLREIAAVEGVAFQSVEESIKAAIKNIVNNL